MLDAMERLVIDDNSPPPEVLDGQTCIEDLFAELGFEWRAGSAEPEMPADGSTGGLMGQAALF
jgi:hypothetical protein